MAAAKKLFIGGNFKAAGTFSTVKSEVEVLNGMGELPANAEVMIAPTAIHIGHVKAALRPDIGVGVQDIHTAKGLGAYTGSHTIDLVKDFGLGWVLTGHSERRSIWGETDAQTAEKTKIATEAGLRVVLCIGETLAEREAGHTLDVVFRQLKAVTDVLPKDAWSQIVVAYEPVWAIGTGKVATKEQAQEVHAALRKWFSETIGPDAAAALRIVYGGSVNAANCVSLISEPDIDGFLVGGASLKPEFVEIIKSTLKKSA